MPPMVLPGVTLTAVCPAQSTALVAAVHSLADALRNSVDTQLDAIWAAQAAAHGFMGYRLYDLASFCQSLVTQPSATPESIAAAQKVLTVLADPAFLLAQKHTSPDYADLGGLTTYLMTPLSGYPVSAYYAETDYAQATNWGNFLQAYYDAAP
jgi:hypothetical protein